MNSSTDPPIPTPSNCSAAVAVVVSLGMEPFSVRSPPPGFGFHPTDEEIVSHYLKRKVLGQKVDPKLIPVVEIYKLEPWDLPEKCPIPSRDSKWHFFALRDRKYRNGSRANRATEAGYWKSTGKDRNIKSHNQVIGTKKTLVFHEGRPPYGKRTEWIMHEYYIDESECKAAPESKDIFVLCRVTKRDGWASQRTGLEFKGQEASVQIGPGNNYVEKPNDVPDLAVHEKPSDPSDDHTDAWLASLFCPDSVLECITEPNHETQLDQAEADEFDYLLPEDIDSILQFNSDNFAPFDGFDMETLAAENIPQSTSQVASNSVGALESNFREIETNGSSMLSDGGFTSPELNGTDKAGIVIRQLPPAPEAHFPAAEVRFQRTSYGSCKLQVSRAGACRLKVPVNGTIKFSHENIHLDLDEDRNKNINSMPPVKEKPVCNDEVSHYCNNSYPSDAESVSGSQGNKSVGTSEKSQESVSTSSDTVVDDTFCHQGGTHKVPGTFNYLFKPAGPNHLFLSAFVIALAAFLYFLLCKSSGPYILFSNP